MRFANRTFAVLFTLILGASILLAGPRKQPIPQEAHRINDREVKAAISKIDSRADKFRRSLHDSLRHSDFRHSGEEQDINRFVKDFDAATDRLKHHFDSHNPATADAEDVMRRAATIDEFMRAHSMNGRANEDWRALRHDLDTLAAAYGVDWRWEQ